MSALRRTLRGTLVAGLLAAGAAFGFGRATDARAEIQVVNGVRYECSDGLCRRLDAPAEEEDASTGNTPALRPTRLAQGYMDAEAFLAFLRGDEPPALPASVVWLVLSLVLAGVAMNLTPCVLPMIPVNLLVIGASPTRGLFYGLGIALAYGLLGVFAAVGGLAFGTIQASPAFNALVAVVFITLGLSLCGVFPIDFTRIRGRAGVSSAIRASAVFPFLMGALSAMLAGACVAPVLISALVLTAKLYAQGRLWALGLPFALGLGMALPWPFLGAGLHVLPKPGSWMRWVNRAFAVLVFGLATWHAGLAVKDLTHGDARDDRDGSGVLAVDLASLESFESLLSQASAGQPILVDCWATWCKNCAAMERGTLRDPKVAEVLKDFTVIRLQAEDVTALQRLPGFSEIRGLPAFALFD